MSFKAIFNTSLSVFVLAITFISVANATEVDLGFDSQYVTEGRQQLDKGGIYWVNASGQYDENFSLGVAYGLAADSAIDYDELNIYLEYADAFAGVQYAIGYTRLEFLADSENDNELTLALAYTSLESVTPFSNITYSTQSNGFFVNLGVRKSMQINPLASVNLHPNGATHLRPNGAT